MQLKKYFTPENIFITFLAILGTIGSVDTILEALFPVSWYSYISQITKYSVWLIVILAIFMLSRFGIRQFWLHLMTGLNTSLKDTIAENTAVLKQEIGFLRRSARQLANIANKYDQISLSQASPANLTQNHASQAYQYFAQRYGIGYISIDVQWTVSTDGSAKVQRTINVEAYSEISMLDTFLLVPERVKTNDGDIIGIEDISSMTPGTTASLLQEIEKSGRQSTLITISPPMNVADSMTYKMIENLPQGLYVMNATADTLKERETAYDYAGWTINRPTKHITLRVFFPEGVEAPKIYSAEVRYSSTSGFPSTRIQHEEQTKMKPEIIGPEGNRYILRLDVAYPMVGLIYILRWQPDSFPR